MGAQGSKRKQPLSEGERKMAEKLQQARERPYLRCNNMGLTEVPLMLSCASGEVETAIQKEVLEKLRSADFQANRLQSFPPISLPALTDLNLYGNNMTNAMLEVSSASPLASLPHLKKKRTGEKLRMPFRRTSKHKATKEEKQKDSKAKSSTLQPRSASEPTAGVALVEEEKEKTELGAFSLMPTLDSLDLSNNLLEYAPPSLASCSKLEQLNLEGNVLAHSDVALAALEGLEKLTMINLTLNRLSAIPDQLFHLNLLYTVLMRGNSVTDVPADLSRLTALQKLDLSDNCIEEVSPKAFVGLSSLKMLLLSRNGLRCLPPCSFESMASLTQLVLHHNRLESLPVSLSSLSSLRVLDASHNCITHLDPSSLSGLICVTELNLSHNQLASLPTELACVREVRKLDLSYNRLSCLPCSVAELDDLQDINLDANCLSSAGKVTKKKAKASDEPISLSSSLPIGGGAGSLSPTVEELLASACTEQGDGCEVLWQMANLERISLNRNQLESLPEAALSQLSRLEFLSLASNRLTTDGLPRFGPSAESGVESVLEQVVLSNNLLSEFPVALLLPSASTLHRLLLDCNPIPCVPEAVSSLTSLRYLTISLPVAALPAFDRSFGMKGQEKEESKTGDKNETASDSVIKVDTVDEEEEEEKGTETEENEDVEAMEEGEEEEKEDGEKSVEEKRESGEAKGKAKAKKKKKRAKAQQRKTTDSVLLWPKERKSGSSLRLSARLALTRSRELDAVRNLEAFFPANFGEGLSKLQRLYVGNYANGGALTEESLPFSSSSLPGLKCTDIVALSAFPSFSCSPSRVGYLTSGRPASWAVLTGTAPHPVEDCVCIRTLQLHGAIVDFVGVFDGHGGCESAVFVQENLWQVVERRLREAMEEAETETLDDVDVSVCMVAAFAEVNDALVDVVGEEEESNVGCTGAVALVSATHVYSANVGDSRVVLATLDRPTNLHGRLHSSMAASDGDLATRGRTATETNKLKLSKHRVADEEECKGQRQRQETDPPQWCAATQPTSSSRVLSSRLTVDHKPGLRAEVARIRTAGTFVVPDGAGNAYRISNGTGIALAVSRSFGDFHLRPGMVCLPHVAKRPLSLHDRFLVVASDGTWDVLSDQDASEFVQSVLVRHKDRPHLACSLAASHLRDLAAALGSGDDLSVIVVSLTPV